MKVLFLDIDGVLNSSRWYKERERRGLESDEICPAHTEQLNRILRATNVKVVLSSTWRKSTPLPEMIKLLQSKGCILESFLGATPVHDDGYRGREIKTWLDVSGVSCRITDFVILDDDSDMEPHMDKLVKTRFETGLRETEADEVIRRLT